MVWFEAVDAHHGDCLLLYHGDGNRNLWVIDGGPGTKNGVLAWRDRLLPRLEELYDGDTPEALGVCTHIDDDHIAGMISLMQRFAHETPSKPARLRFREIWFNSLEKLQEEGAALAGGAGAQAVSMQQMTAAGVNDVVIQSVGQGETLATLINAAGSKFGLAWNLNANGCLVADPARCEIPGPADERVTVLSPTPASLRKLYEEWVKALAERDAKRRAVEIQSLLERGPRDTSYANLSSICLLVEVEDKKLLLTGDARADHIVDFWKNELGRGACSIDVLKIPHHGSVRNMHRSLLETFPATHYVFSADGEHQNPDPDVVEGILEVARDNPALFSDRKIELHFTNDLEWETAHGPQAGGAARKTLSEFLAELESLYPTVNWSWSIRPEGEHSVRIRL